MIFFEVQFSSQCLLDSLQLSLELAEFFKGDIDSLLLDRSIWLSNLENKNRPCLVNILAVGRGNLMPQNDLKICKLLQAHQACDSVKTMRLSHLSVYGCSQGLYNRSLLNRAPCRNFFNQFCLRSLDILRAVRSQIGDDQSLEGVRNSLDFFIRPVDPLVFELSRDRLRTELSSCFGTIGDLGSYLRD